MDSSSQEKMRKEIKDQLSLDAFLTGEPLPYIEPVSHTEKTPSDKSASLVQPEFKKTLDAYVLERGYITVGTIIRNFHISATTAMAAYEDLKKRKIIRDDGRVFKRKGRW